MVLIENRAYQGTYITICNYETYQNQGQAIELAEGQARGKRGTSGGAINNKENKINKENKENYTVNDFSFLGDERFAGLWNDYLKSRKTKLNVIGQKASLKKLHKYTIDISCKALEKSIESGYTGLFPESIKPNKPIPTRPSIVMDKIYT